MRKKLYLLISFFLIVIVGIAIKLNSEQPDISEGVWKVTGESYGKYTFVRKEDQPYYIEIMKEKGKTYNVTLFFPNESNEKGYYSTALEDETEKYAGTYKKAEETSTKLILQNEKNEKTKIEINKNDKKSMVHFTNKDNKNIKLTLEKMENKKYDKIEADEIFDPWYVGYDSIEFTKDENGDIYLKEKDEKTGPFQIETRKEEVKLTYKEKTRGEENTIIIRFKKTEGKVYLLLTMNYRTVEVEVKRTKQVNDE